ncbi:MAG: YkgJ family cysteine cluster protein [Nitrososphaeria archaeon]
MNPCIAHGCHSCCVRTEMPLTMRDVERLESLGYRREDFTRHVDGVLVLATKDSGDCFFLGEDGLCTVYERRPDGCRIYPLVWSAERGAAILDPDCPYTREFSFGPDDVSVLMGLVREIYGEEALKGGDGLGNGRCPASGRL